MTSKANRPWHRRFSPIGRMRGMMRASVFRFVQKLLATDDGRRIVADSVKGALPLSRVEWESFNRPAHVHDLGIAQQRPASRRPILVTARFRTGSTLLWNLFRKMEGVTAYYEPLNERRWFDPAVHGQRVDGTHRGVEDYWTEYTGLEILGEYYQESWIRRNLLMDGDFWDPRLERYVEILVERAASRPVLQFNRIDFRLPWFRRHFPDAVLVHLYRHPRDQWCSTLMNTRAYPSTSHPQNFAEHDHFYQRVWAEDLQYHFPFLASDAVEHPYQQFYYLWKLSYLFGMKYADYSLAYEDLVARPRQMLSWLIEELELPAQNIEQLAAVVDLPSLGRWKEYADNDWFVNHEAKCETVLERFFQSSKPRPTNGAVQCPQKPRSMEISPFRNGTTRNHAVPV